MSDSAYLIGRLREQRKSKVKVGEWTFIVRRPTDQEWGLSFAGLTGDQYAKKAPDICKTYVVDWEGVTELMVIRGGNSDINVDFDPDLWGEMVPDHPEFWSPIAIHIVDQYNTYVQRRAEREKKS